MAFAVQAALLADSLCVCPITFREGEGASAAAEAATRMAGLEGVSVVPLLAAEGRA
jgi:hypothetical protein